MYVVYVTTPFIPHSMQIMDQFFNTFVSNKQPFKINLNKKLDPQQKTILTFNIDAQGLRKTENENPLTWEIRVTC